MRYQLVLLSTYPSSVIMASDEVLYQNEYVSVRLEHQGKVVRVTRTAKVVPAPEQLESVYEPVIAAINRIGRRGRCLLSDVRLAPGRNTPGYEEAFAKIRARMMPGFDRIGTLVQTKIGMLQLHRQIREDGVERTVSADENELLIYFGIKPK